MSPVTGIGMEALKTVVTGTAGTALCYFGFYTLGIVTGFIIGVALSIPAVRKSLRDIRQDLFG